MPQRTAADRPQPIAPAARRPRRTAATVDPARRRPAAAPLRAREERLLRCLGRWGFLSRAQNRELHRAAGPRAVADLYDRGWLRATRLAHALPAGVAYSLTPAGRRALADLPAAPPPLQADLGQVDRLLAAVDLARWLSGRGWTWTPWTEPGLPVGAAERLRAERVPPPHGLVGRPGDRRLPAWLLLCPLPLWDVRRRVLVGSVACGVGSGYVFAPPQLCAQLREAEVPALLEAWDPPHLGGRAPFRTGWLPPNATPPSHRSHRGAVPAALRPDRLGPAALATLDLLDRFGYATAGQLARARGLAARSAHPDLRRLLALGLVQAEALGGRLQVWSATPAGQAAAGSGRAPVPRHPLHPRHSLALLDLAEGLGRRTGGRWATERELRSEAGRAGGPPLPPPDARLTLPDGRRALIQLQLTAASPAALDGFVGPHLASGSAEEVWYVCVPHLAAALRRRWVGDERVRVMPWRAPHFPRRRSAAPEDPDLTGVEGARA